MNFLKWMVKLRASRFLFFGGSAAALNVVIMCFFISFCDWNSAILRNFANVISVEISLLYSFVVYRLFVWQDRPLTGGKSAASRLIYSVVRYHFSAATAIFARGLVIFPILDMLGMHFVMNTIIGAGFSCVINYGLSNRFVFKAIDANAGEIRGENVLQASESLA